MDDLPICPLTDTALGLQYYALFSQPPVKLQVPELGQSQDYYKIDGQPVIRVSERVHQQLKNSIRAEPLLESYAFLNYHFRKMDFVPKQIIEEHFPQIIAAFEEAAKPEQQRAKYFTDIEEILGLDLVVNRKDHFCNDRASLYGYILAGTYRGHALQAQSIYDEMVPIVDVTLSENVDGVGYHLLQKSLSSSPIKVEYNAKIGDDRSITLDITRTISANTPRILQQLSMEVKQLEKIIQQAQEKRIKARIILR